MEIVQIDKDKSMIKIFHYIPELDCFTIHPYYKSIANDLGLNEWHEAVWVGRLFSLDNDYGEHWFDNWELREALGEKAKQMGIHSNDLLIIDPARFKNEKDGPCHTDDERLNFWRDVLISLHLSPDTIFAEARKLNLERVGQEEQIPHLEERIKKWMENNF